MASIRKRGSSYLIVVSMGYDYKATASIPSKKPSAHQRDSLPSNWKNGFRNRQSCSRWIAKTTAIR